MRILRFSTAPPPYLAAFFRQRPLLAPADFARLSASLMGDFFAWADSWTTPLRPFGYEMWEVVANAQPVQQQWAREHGLPDQEADWLVAIALAQVRAFRPEILFITDWSPGFGAAFVERCRQAWPGLRLVIGWCGEAHPAAEYYQAHDLVLSCAPESVAFLRTNGIPAQHLNHAFDPRILERLQTDPAAAAPAPSVGFIGQVLHGSSFHNQRARLLAAVCDELDVALYGLIDSVPEAAAEASLKGRLRAAYVRAGATLERWSLGGVTHRLPKYRAYAAARARAREQAELRALFAFLANRAKPAVFGLEMYRVLRSFAMCLNAHGPAQFASNMRLYEATGVGTCLLTDDKQGLATLFEPDREVVTYRQPAECVEKARYLLAHPAERQRIAAAGQCRALREHTFTNRAGRLHKIISEALPHRHPRTPPVADITHL